MARIKVVRRSALLRISSAVSVQTKGWERSFQPSMKVRILVLRYLTDFEDALSDGLALNDSEPDLDQIHPGGMDREVGLEPRVLLEPRANVRVLVRGVAAIRSVRDLRHIAAKDPQVQDHASRPRNPPREPRGSAGGDLFARPARPAR